MLICFDAEATLETGEGPVRLSALDMLMAREDVDIYVVGPDGPEGYPTISTGEGISRDLLEARSEAPHQFFRLYVGLAIEMIEASSAGFIEVSPYEFAQMMDHEPGQLVCQRCWRNTGLSVTQQDGSCPHCGDEVGPGPVAAPAGPDPELNEALQTLRGYFRRWNREVDREAESLLERSIETVRQNRPELTAREALGALLLNYALSEGALGILLLVNSALCRYFIGILDVGMAGRLRGLANWEYNRVLTVSWMIDVGIRILRTMERGRGLGDEDGRKSALATKGSELLREIFGEVEASDEEDADETDAPGDVSVEP